MESEFRVGRPSKYKAEFCKKLIEHMSVGYSFESFAAVAKVHKDTLYQWVDAHPEFKEAKDAAFGECLLFWEKLGIDNIINESESHGKEGGSSRSLNGSVWIFNMKNRFKWRDKQPDEVDTVVNNTNNVSTMSDEEIDRKIQEKMKKAGAGG